MFKQSGTHGVTYAVHHRLRHPAYTAPYRALQEKANEDRLESGDGGRRVLEPASTFAYVLKQHGHPIPPFL